MSDENLDPRKQTLVAALYGELSEDEHHAFLRMLESDPELRAEWDELRGTRLFLEEWGPEETAPGFVFLDSSEPARRAEGGILRRLRGIMSPPAWGFAGASAVLAALVLAGFRVDRVENGLAFRFGPPAEIRSSSRTSGSPSRDLASGPGAIDSPTGGQVRLVPVSAEAELITTDEMDTYMAFLMRAVDARLSDYQQRQNGEMAYVLQSFYREIRDKQMRDYGVLRDQIEGVELGMYEPSRMSSLPDSLFHRPEPKAGDPSKTTDDSDPREEDQE